MLVVVLRVILGLVMGVAPTCGSLWRGLCLVAVIGVAVAWGFRDARTDSSADLTVRWLLTGLVAGFLSGALSWALAEGLGLELGGNGLLYEVTSAASFITLLVFLPALIGVGVSRWRAGRTAVAA
ncbi:hypothetical protein GCM10011591_09010 [Nocardia camponoti]|uniref:Uncharacterized protein n=2 Tax=Nocardia camponoti TaxID=1616106 RepID=A0A917QAH3_9NOCA|nr:hypothetical protein GCM10011591_09010 [Nocardia camponoti]